MNYLKHSGASNDFAVFAIGLNSLANKAIRWSKAEFCFRFNHRLQPYNIKSRFAHVAVSAEVRLRLAIRSYEIVHYIPPIKLR
jgi:hypothetical protein